jgi:uncharacterized damage-inducible protein DinB
MYNTIQEFIQAWKSEAKMTEHVLEVLTDESLSQPITDGHRTLGRIAWHITTTIPEMMGYTGLGLQEMLKPDAPVPTKATEIVGAYKNISAAMVDEISKKWNDDSLKIADEMYGEKWERRFTVTALIQHQIHHRGQMTVLLRQAGIKVPSIYGPAKEDWQAYGMEVPEV